MQITTTRDCQRPTDVVVDSDIGDNLDQIRLRNGGDMIIRTVHFKKLHGYLDLKLSFRRGVNILVGVNGSGKTSILNAMSWTLSPASVQDGIPAAHLLSGLEFDEINIAYTNPGERKHKRVTAKRKGDSVSIRVSGIDEQLDIPIVGRRQLNQFSTARVIDEPSDLVSRFLEDRINNPVLRHLNELSGPLYLPLNRRWTEDREPRYRRQSRRSTAAGYLPISEVLTLAERVFRQEQFEVSALNDELRNNIVASLFEGRRPGSAPRVWTLSELEERRSRIGTALSDLGLGNAQRLSEGYFDRLRDIVEQLGGQTIPENFSDDPNASKWFEWILDASLIASRIERLIPIIEKYESDRSKVTRRSNMFLESVNSFLHDNGKRLTLQRGFELMVHLPNGQSITSHHLSSGELQLLVLFTFLCFQFDTEQEFAVFVDEPELSLHVAWQNRYVNSITGANPNAQFIIATHSPEIAGPS